MTALRLARATVKIEESAPYDSQSNGLTESASKDVKDAVRTNLACLVRRFGREFLGRQASPGLACEVLRGDGEQMQGRPRWQQGAQVRASSAAFCGEDPLCDHLESRWVRQESNQDGR